MEITLQEVIALAGGATTNGHTVFVGGLMMGRIETDLSKPVTIGQVVADIPEGKLAARIHSSIDGSVIAVNGAITIEQS